MKLIIGLGNPAGKYKNNRHNAGFLALDYFISQNSWQPFTESSKFKAALSEHKEGNQKTILVKPLTYMNASGEAVQSFMNFYKVESKDILVLYDELALDFGTVRSRDEGSSAGHNGVESLIKVIGKGFTRVRIGIANEHSKKQDASDFVLGDFNKEEAAKLPLIFDHTNQLIHEFITVGKLEPTTHNCLEDSFKP